MNNMLSNSMWLYITFNSNCWTWNCTWNFADKHHLAHLNFIVNFHIAHSNSGSIHVCLTAVTEALYTDYIPVNNNSFVKDLSVYFLWTCVRIRNWQIERENSFTANLLLHTFVSISILKQQKFIRNSQMVFNHRGIRADWNCYWGIKVPIKLALGILHELSD